MKLIKTAISGFIVVSFFISAPAFGAPKSHKKVVVVKKTVVINKAAPAPAVIAPEVTIREVTIITPTANVATSFVFTPEAAATVVVSDPVVLVPVMAQTPVGAPTISQVLPPVVVQPPAPVIVSQEIAVVPPVSGAPPICGNSIPAVGQSCTYTPAPTTQTTSQVLAPNTIGFQTQPTDGQQTYTPVVQTGTPENGVVNITVSGNATTDGTTVTFLDNGVVAITASQTGATPVTQVVQVSGVLSN